MRLRLRRFRRRWFRRPWFRRRWFSHPQRRRPRACLTRSRRRQPLGYLSPPQFLLIRFLPTQGLPRPAHAPLNRKSRDGQALPPASLPQALRQFSPQRRAVRTPKRRAPGSRIQNGERLLQRALRSLVDRTRRTRTRTSALLHEPRTIRKRRSSSSTRRRTQAPPQCSCKIHQTWRPARQPERPRFLHPLRQCQWPPAR